MELLIVKDVTDFRTQKRCCAWLLRNEILNNVAGRGKGRKYFAFNFRYNYLFSVGITAHFMLYLPPH